MKLNPTRFLKAASRLEQAEESIVRGQHLVFNEDWSVALEPCLFLAEQIDPASESIDTHSQYGSVLKRFFLACNENAISWKQVSLAEILAYRRQMVERPFKARSINQHLAVIRSFYTWALTRGLIVTSPFPERRHRWERNKLKVPEEDTPPRAIPIAHLQKIIAQLSDTVALAVKLALTSGLRANEIAKLRRGQLPAMESQNQAFCYVSVRRKGNKIRNVAIPVGLLDELHRYIDFGERTINAQHEKNPFRSRENGNYVFLGRSGRPISRSRLSKMFRAAVVKAGFADKTYDFHGLRHTYAITMLKQLQGANDEQIRQTGRGFNVLLVLRNLMGHSQLSTTEIYLTSLARDAAEVSDSIVNLFEQLIQNTTHRHERN